MKILKGGKYFRGVDYNQLKEKRGEAVLLHKANFEGMMNSMSNKEYFQLVALLNPRVERKQFHSILSSKGEENSLEELKVAALQYISYMGYQNSPLLIYGHTDTQNNHVHIVSSRVDLSGKKIDDSYEKIRSVTWLRQYLGELVKIKLNEDLRDSLSFSFSTKAQLLLLMELKGYKTREKEGQIEFIKDGKVQMRISQSKITDQSSSSLPKPIHLTEFLINNRELNERRLIEEVFRNHQALLVFHWGKNHEMPYGYTVIDYKNKIVHKGSSVLPLRELLEKKENAITPPLKNTRTIPLDLFLRGLIKENSENEYRRKRNKKRKR